MKTALRLGEFVATLALAQDNARSRRRGSAATGHTTRLPIENGIPGLDRRQSIESLAAAAAATAAAALWATQHAVA